VKSP